MQLISNHMIVLTDEYYSQIKLEPSRSPIELFGNLMFSAQPFAQAAGTRDSGGEPEAAFPVSG